VYFIPSPPIGGRGQYQDNIPHPNPLPGGEGIKRGLQETNYYPLHPLGGEGKGEGGRVSLTSDL